MLSQAAGSAYVEFGNTKVMAGMCAHQAASSALFCIAWLPTHSHVHQHLAQLHSFKE